MDTMKILLGATVALLLGAVAISWQGMTQGVRDTPKDEIARLKAQVDELRREQDRLQLEKQMQALRTAEPVAPPVTNSERDAMKAELALKEAELRRIQDEKDKAERTAKLVEDENLTFEKRELEKGDGELRRARLISEALLMGRVKEYEDDPNLGGFVTFEVLMPDNVQSGSILAIRRKTGIAGQLKVSEITVEGGIANVLPGFGPVKPEPGDELILPPQY
jgi:hypothetical protein